MNHVVIHTAGGEILKGITVDFMPTKDHFHMVPAEGPDRRAVEVRLPGLKALFFVRDFEGDSGHAKSNLPGPGSHAMGRKVRVAFRDGEVMVGWTQGYQPGRLGFFVVPVDPKSNNERCFVISAAVESVTFPEG